jgi:predicted Holliday junction resolvase-like endonuclease
MIFILLILIVLLFINIANINKYKKILLNDSDVLIVNLDEYNNKRALTDEESVKLKQEQISLQMEKSITSMEEVSSSKVNIYIRNNETIVDVKLYLFPTKKLTDLKLDNIRLFIEGSIDVSKSNINIDVF